MNVLIKYIPLFLALSIVTFPLGLLAISVSMGHVKAIFPYVSDLGITPPIASIFSLFMCAGSSVFGLFVLFRYDLTLSHVHKSKVLSSPSTKIQSQAANHKTNHVEQKILKKAIMSLVSGTIMTVGFLCVGCFRNSETVGTQIFHNISAGIAFTAVLVDIYFEISIAKLLDTCRLASYRRLIFYLSVIFLAVYLIGGVASFVTNPDAFINKSARLNWSSTDPGYYSHLVSTVVEWLMIYLLSPYLLTYHSLFLNARYLNQ